MSAWQEIVGVAAVGTERQEVKLPPAGSALGRALAGLDLSDREGALLGAAALVALHRQAGSRAAVDPQSLPEPGEPDPAPRCPAAAGQHLALMLGGEFKEALPEWLGALRGAGRRVPEEHLPALLERGRAEAGLRHLVADVIGNRGRWLAVQNAAWRWAAAGAGPDVWEAGGRDERLFLLRSLRETDPPGARELLSSTWKDESARDRQSFLQVLHAGLSEDDEPFLTEALQDRGAEVRRTAADILLRLPSSRLTRLVSERVGSLLNYRKPMLRKAQIEVNLPDDPEAWQSENQLSLGAPSAAAAAPTTLGKKGWWLRHAVGSVPPAHWCRLWGKTPGEVLEAATNGEWGEALSGGFITAAGRHGDVDWIEALLANQQTRQAVTRGAHATVPGLVSRLPAARLEAIILKELAAGKKGAPLDQLAIQLLFEHKAEWGDALSRAAVAGIKGRVEASMMTEPADWLLKSALKQFALYVSHELADEVSAGRPWEAEESWQGPLEEFRAVLGFRRDMLRAVVKEEGMGV